MTYNDPKTSVVNAPTKSAIDTTLVALNDLSPDEKQAAVAIIECAEREGELDPQWTASFIEVLTVLKAEEI